MLTGCFHTRLQKQYKISNIIVNSTDRKQATSYTPACRFGVGLNLKCYFLNSEKRKTFLMRQLFIQRKGFSFLQNERFKVHAGLEFDFDYLNENGLVTGLLPGIKPDPVKFPRRPLNLKFAVLLMRSSYEACDDLDFIAMNSFQEKFWKLRQSEVEPYTLQYSPIKVRAGELTDPLYFDFISFAQYAAISEAMKNGKMVFQERSGAFGELKTIRRDESIGSNSVLPIRLKEVVGDRIYHGLVDGFEEVEFGGPAACQGGDFECVLSGIRQILNVFVDQGFALSATVSDVRDIRNGLSFKVRVEGPATLWGIRELASRLSLTSNDYEAMAICAFARASNRVAHYKSKFSDTRIEHVFSIS